MTSSSPSPLIRFQDVSKHYGACRANDKLNFEIAAGSIHAIIGENGAGKSTAMKLLFGMERPTSGQIFVRGRTVHYGIAKEAMNDGIGMVHQHFMLSPVHTPLENILLGREKTKSLFTKSLFSWVPKMFRFLDREGLERELSAIAKTVGFQIPWHTPVGALAVGIQQQIEILKLLHAGVEVMILDEPTAVLSPIEIEQFLSMLRSLKTQGKTIIIITHKLKEVKAVADTITVMRAGTTVQTLPAPQASVQQLADLMVGRAVHLSLDYLPAKARTDVAMSLEHLDLWRGEDQILKDISFAVSRGEILGVAGVEGNGQSELMHLLYDPAGKNHAPYRVQGKIEIHGDNALPWPAKTVRAKSVGVVAADRHRESVLLSESLVENNILGHEADFKANFARIDRRKALAHTKTLVQTYDVRPANPDHLMRNFSGGNQQKFVMARELSRKPKLLLCSQPTRGVDVGSIEQIHSELQKAKTEGMGILLVSSQLEELMQLSDRIIVMYEGRVAALFLRDEFDERQIGLAMCGGRT